VFQQAETFCTLDRAAIVIGCARELDVTMYSSVNNYVVMKIIKEQEFVWSGSTAYMAASCALDTV
jgi:hypothetical protein